jgi:hypothetical protein
VRKTGQHHAQYTKNGCYGFEEREAGHGAKVRGTSNIKHYSSIRAAKTAYQAPLEGTF